jgi:integrase
MRLPAYLKRTRHGVFYLRHVIGARPGDGAQYPNRLEFTASLRTTRPAVAATLSRCLVPWLTPHVAAIAGVLGTDRQGARRMAEELQARVRGWVAQVRVGDAEVSVRADGNDPADLAAGRLALQDVLAALFGRTSTASASPTASALPNTATRVPPATAATVAVSIAEAIEHSLTVNSATRVAKTTLEYAGIFRTFANWLGERGITGVAQVTSAHISSYRAHLVAPRGLTPKTINKKIAALNSLFEDAQRAGHFPEAAPLPTRGQLFAKKAVAKAAKSWLPFDDADLEAIFAPERFLLAKKPHEHWVPLLLLHQGLRVGEASQLRTDDVAEATGYWTLRVSDEAPGTRTKTQAAKRVVPLHPALLELGLPDYLADVRRLTGGEAFLFPYLNTKSVNGMGDVPGAALNAYLASVLKHARKRSHSFRHTVNDRLKQAGVTEEVRCEFVGHEYETTNSSVYASRLNACAMADIVFPALAFRIDYARLGYRPGRFDGAIRRALRQRCARKRAQDAADAATIDATARSGAGQS